MADSPQRRLFPSTDLPEAAAVTMEVVEGRRFVKWEGGEDLYHAPHWVWSLVAQAEERGRREGRAEVTKELR